MTKTAGLIAGLSNALRRRGVDEELSALAAEIGMAAFSRATSAWLADPTSDLRANLEKAHAHLRTLSLQSSA